MGLKKDEDVSVLKEIMLQAWLLQIRYHEAQILENQKEIERITKIVDELKIYKAELKKLPVVEKASNVKSRTASTRKTKTNSGLASSTEAKSNEPANPRKSKQSKGQSEVKLAKLAAPAKKLSTILPKLEPGVKMENSAIQQRKARTQIGKSQEKTKNAMVQLSAAGFEAFEAMVSPVSIMRAMEKKQRRVTFAAIDIIASSNKISSLNRVTTLTTPPLKKRRQRSRASSISAHSANPFTDFVLPSSPESLDLESKSTSRKRPVEKLKTAAEIKTEP